MQTLGILMKRSTKKRITLTKGLSDWMQRSIEQLIVDDKINIEPFMSVNNGRSSIEKHDVLSVETVYISVLRSLFSLFSLPGNEAVCVETVNEWIYSSAFFFFFFFSLLFRFVFSWMYLQLLSQILSKIKKINRKKIMKFYQLSKTIIKK